VLTVNAAETGDKTETDLSSSIRSALIDLLTATFL